MTNRMTIGPLTMRRVWIAALTSGLAVFAASAQAVPEIRNEQVIRLADAFPELDAAKGHTFRARQIELPPGSRTEVMAHAGRPSITYVTGGSVSELREGAPSPVAHETGAAILARADVTHAWENVSALPASLLIVEILPNP